MPTNEELKMSGWTRSEWERLVEAVKARNIKELVKILDENKEYEWGIPLAMDVAEALEINIDDLVKEFALDGFIPVLEILKKQRRRRYE